jgi:FAD/FMN-containing dehydrogenase
VLLELSGGGSGPPLAETLQAILASAIERGIVGDATVAASQAQAQALWRIRETLPEAQRPEGGSIKHDTSVPVSQVPRFLERARAAVEALIPGARPVPFGHLGDGNVHFNISQPVGADRSAFLARWAEVSAAVHAIALDLGGSISAEHGIGVLKREAMAAIKSPVELDLMRGLKRLLDPNGILNPGKLLP